MRTLLLPALVLLSTVPVRADEPRLVARPDAFRTLVNPACSHCRDEAKRRAAELRADDRVLCWTRGYSDGGAIPIRFFLSPYRVISDSYGVFVYDPEAGYARGFAPSYEFRFHGWRNGVMVMQHKDGTLYSCLTGEAFAGPRKGDRLTAVPTVVSDWGQWLERYPEAVAYHMFDKYQPVDLPTKDEADSVRSRGTADARLPADTPVLGVRSGKSVRAYPVSALERDGLLRDEFDGAALVLLWEPRTRTASAYRPVASQPRKFKGPRPDASGVSPPDAGETVPPGAPVVPPRKLTLKVAAKGAAAPFEDAETHSLWDVAGRCVAGELKGWTLEWVESVQVKWFAWAAEYPQTSLRAEPEAPADPNKNVREVAGTSEFLRVLPKPFATLQAIDPQRRTVTLLLDGEKEAKVWPVEPDAEIKVGAWWGRLEQLKAGQRVWVWLKLDRKKTPVSVVLLADEVSEFDMHSGLRRRQPNEKPKFTSEEIDARRTEQKAWLRKRWTEEGLPGTLTFHHVFSGELELMLDHEAMRWGRSLKAGDVVHLSADPVIKGVVKSAAPWRERTAVRIVVGELESSELRIGQRLTLRMTPPPQSVDDAVYPSDMDRPRSRAERIEWFLASVYCTCGVSKDVCTGHFYTLASCNPNACAMPNHLREQVAEMIDKGWSDRRIFDELIKAQGPLLLRPHLRP
jgi:hypothetical protein